MAYGLALGSSVSAAAEESGWMGYAVDPIHARTSALNAGLVLGGAWAVWHLVPLVHAHRPPA